MTGSELCAEAKNVTIIDPSCPYDSECVNFWCDYPREEARPIYIIHALFAYMYTLVEDVLGNFQNQKYVFYNVLFSRGNDHINHLQLLLTNKQQ